MAETLNGTWQQRIAEYVEQILQNQSSGSEKSTDNSVSNETVTTGNEWTGTWEENPSPSIMVNIVSDVNVTYYIEFSIDSGTTTQTSLSFNYDTTRINAPHIFEVGTRAYRIRVANDSGSTGTISVYTDFGTFNKLTSPINGLLSENYDALSVRPTDYTEEVAQGKRQGRVTWNKWGYNDDVDTGGEEIIASWGGTWQPPTAAETVDFDSTSADDTSGGTGLNSIVITGIDADRNSQVEVLTLNGTTTVTTVNTWLGINRVAPFLCGSGKTNAGTIMGKQTTSAITMAEMPVGETVTQQAIFFVQDNHTFLADWIHINVIKISGGGGQPEVTIRGYVWSPVANANIQIFKAKVDTQRENTIDLNPKEPFPITENSVLYFTAETDTNNTSVDLRFSGKEVRNS